MTEPDADRRTRPISERPLMDVRDLVANFPWDEVPDPPAGSAT